MKRIPLTRNRFAVVDDCDYDAIVAKGKWCVSAGYAARAKGVLMHHLVLDLAGIPRGQYTDHRNGDTLDNRRRNVRPATARQNHQNKRKPRAGRATSQYKGVCWDKERDLWRALIRVNGVRKHLGRFSSERDAARAYDDAARLYFGEFARVNL